MGKFKEGWYFLKGGGLAYVKEVFDGLMAGAFPCGEYEAWGLVKPEDLVKKLGE